MDGPARKAMKGKNLRDPEDRGAGIEGSATAKDRQIPPEPSTLRRNGVGLSLARFIPREPLPGRGWP